MRFIEAGHLYAGLPWWGSIVAASLVLRLAVMPLYFKGLRAGAKMKEVQPQMKALTERMKSARAMGDDHTFQAARESLQGMYKKHKINPLANLASAFAQIPAFILFVWALRRICDNAADFPGWSTGGFLWVQDLSASDPYLTLPIFSAIVNLASVQVNTNIQDSDLMSAKTMKNVFRGFSVAVVPLTAMLPAGLHVYFATTAVSMFTLIAATHSIHVRRFWGLPDVWPVQTPNPVGNVRQGNPQPTVSLFQGPKGAAPPPPPPPPTDTQVIDAKSTVVETEAAADPEELVDKAPGAEEARKLEQQAQRAAAAERAAAAISPGQNARRRKNKRGKGKKRR